MLPLAGTCASWSSVTYSIEETFRSMRCVGFSAAANAGCCSLSGSLSARIGPASTTTASTLRSRPSDSVCSRGAGVGCGSISAHHAPRSIHSGASATHDIRCARSALMPHRIAVHATPSSRYGGRSHTAFASTIPSANNHAAWKIGRSPQEGVFAPGRASAPRVGPGVAD
jgi:hypothetical protein